MITKRYEYIDALRGIAILFIVFGHIPMFCYGLPETAQLTSFRIFTSMVQLPLFFFISGFLFNVKIIFNKSGGVKNEYISRRCQQLLLPAIVLGGIYLLVNGGSVQECLMDKYKCGYWFTWLLFEFLMIQVMLEWIVGKLTIKENDTNYAMICIGIAFIIYIVSIPVVCQRFGGIAGLLGLSLFRYYIYFVVGRLVRVHLYKICAWKYRDVAVTGILVVFISMAVIVWGLEYEWAGLLFHIRMVLFELSALLLIFAVFYRHRNYFAGGNRLVKILILIGRRTLDIYLLHYFFLPQDMHVIGKYFFQYPNRIGEMLLSGMVTMAIVAVCLAVGECMRSSRIFSKYVLGSK